MFPFLIFFRSWIDIWELLSQECREEVVLVDADSLLDTLENYLRKHRYHGWIFVPLKFGARDPLVAVSQNIILASHLRMELVANIQKVIVDCGKD